ncbi:MAG: hypothetical protein IPO08_20695 [Xanthomonadales bacterium]|nr:hypothetical protein [Xanthomonadales bacterium]
MSQLASNCPWWEEKDDYELGRNLATVVERLKNSQGWRKTLASERLSTYMGRETDVDSVDRDTGWLNRYRANEAITFAQSAVNTCVARIAAKQRPKPMVLTQGADFTTRIQARKRSKFLEGQFHEAQGVLYPTLYDLGYSLFEDAAIFDGWAKVTLDKVLKKFAVDRKFSWLIYFDEVDSRHGKPHAIYEQRFVDVGVLCGEFPEKEDIIRSNATKNISPISYGISDKREVIVWEAYTKATCEDEPGMRVVLLGDIVLHKEEWTHDGFPYVPMFWRKARIGCQGIPMVDACRVPQARANHFHDRCAENANLLAGGYLDVEIGAYGEDQMTQLESNEAVKILKRLPGTNPSTITMPQPFAPQVLDLAVMYGTMVFERAGVSELAAQSKREPGVDSGVAIRNMTDLQDMLFLPQARMFEQWFVDVGKVMLWLVNDFIDANPTESITAYLPDSGGFLDSIDWQAVDVGEKSLYTVQIQPGSALADSYGAKLQFVNELLAGGMIDAETAKRFMMQGNPDLEAYSNRTNAQYNWIERLITECLDAEDGEEDMEPPDPLMNLLDATFQMNQAYIEVSSWPNTPETKRRAIRNWITQAIELVQRAKGPAQPPAGAAPPGPGPGAPPPAPPMPGGPPPALN